SAVKTITIAKAAATVSITWADATYNSASHPATATVDGVGGDVNLSPAATLEYFSGSSAGTAGTGTATAPTNAGTYTVRASFAGNGNYNGDSAVKTITIDKAAATVKITWATPQTYNTSTHPATATVDGVGGDVNLSPAATLEYFSGSTAGTAGTGTTTAPTNAGTYTVRASFAGNGNYNGDTAVKTITIAKATATVTLTLTPTTRQYSDTVDLGATIAPAIPGTVQFQKSTNGGSSYSNIGSPVTVSSGAATLSNQQINDAPGTSVRFKAVFSPTDSANYTSAADDKPLTATQENAAATYSGPMFMFTPSVSTGAVSVPVRATIQDPTALPTSDSRYDSSAGDIRNASVKFIAREAGAGFTAGQTICTATLTLIDAADSKTATAACATNPVFNIGSQDSDSVRIGIVVGNYYLEDTSGDDTVITISKPLATQFITGGGYLLLDGTSAGTYKGDAGSKNNFGFNVKYNSKGTNLQGRVNTIIRRGGRVYQVKANNLVSLGVSYCGATAGTIGTCKVTPTAPCTYNASSTCPIQATFTGQASIQDVTNSAAPISIEGGATVQMDMVDWGEPGSNGPAGPDQMGITVWTKTNALWYSSRWNGTKTLMQLLNGGNLVVH
ncbi:MAG: MBG domain-containing protein, partial [Solirubrobacteraceae bacterium]